MTGVTPITPASRLLFWLRASFVGDAAMIVVAVLLLVQHEAPGWWLLVFTGLRSGIGVTALVLAERALTDRHVEDDRPSVLS